jgi:sulfate adenylyltransferase
MTDFPVEYIPLSSLKMQLSSISLPVVAFHTRNPMHFAHIALTLRALQDTAGHLLLHPTVGPAMLDDVDPYVRLAAYRAILQYYPRDANDKPRVTLAAVPLAMRMAGPREALWHALIRKNFGASHFIVGRAHADPGGHPSNPNGFFYEPFAAQDLVQKYAAEIGISVLAYPEYGHSELEGKCTPVELGGTKQLSGTEIRRRLAEGEQIPEWFSPPEVVQILRSAYRGPKGRGLVIFLTGLPAAGKSTIAGILANCLRAVNDRPVTLLDGDIIRNFLSKGLGYTREDRMENIRRIGFVASLIARHGGIAITAAIAPYADARREARCLVEQQGGAFFEVYVSTPLEECERRDPKGLYRAARRGELKHLTGIDDPYEIPTNADIEVGLPSSPEETMRALFQCLYQRKLIPASKPPRLFA